MMYENDHEIKMKKLIVTNQFLFLIIEEKTFWTICGLSKYNFMYNDVNT